MAAKKLTRSSKERIVEVVGVGLRQAEAEHPASLYSIDCLL
jgi:hypothetical protein